MSTYDDDETDLEFFEEPATLEAPGRPRRRIRSPRGGGPRRPLSAAPGSRGSRAAGRSRGTRHRGRRRSCLLGRLLPGPEQARRVQGLHGQGAADRAELGRHRDDRALEGAELPEAHARRLADEARAVVAAAAAGLRRGAAPGTARAAAGRAPAGAGDAPATRDRAHRSRQHARHGGIEGRHPGRGPPRQAGPVAERQRPRLEGAVQAAGDGDLEEAGRAGRDRSAFADHLESRGDPAPFVRGGLRGSALHEHRRQGDRYPRQRAREHRGRLGRPDEDADGLQPDDGRRRREPRLQGHVQERRGTSGK